MKNLNRWLDFIEKENIRSLSNTDLFSNLSNIRIMASNIQDYIQQTCQRIDAIINLIDLKVQEISEIDKRILDLKPSYRKKMRRVTDNSKNLMKALSKEKKIVKKVLAKLRMNEKNIASTNKKTQVLENEHKRDMILNRLKLEINSKLSSFMNLHFFSSAHKKLMDYVEGNFENYLPEELKDLRTLAAKILNTKWKDIIYSEKDQPNKLTQENLLGKKAEDWLAMDEIQDFANKYAASSEPEQLETQVKGNDSNGNNSENEQVWLDVESLHKKDSLKKSKRNKKLRKHK